MDREKSTVRAEVTRRTFLRAAGAGAAWVALAGTLGCDPAERQDRPDRADASPARPGEVSVRDLPSTRPGSTWSFRSRPDLAPPAVEVDTRAQGTAAGYVFLAPKKGQGQNGPIILDDDGNPVWFRPLPDDDRDAMDFKAQAYRGEPVLTWWEGVHAGYGRGEYVILDTRYREVARVRAGNGYYGDHHEFLITPKGTALITIYHEVPYDLSPLGGPTDGMVVDGIVQEVDIETGGVIFEWHSLEHVAVDESHGDLPEDPRAPFDYFHINSIDVDADENLLVSARRTFAVYKIDRESGEVIWRLGGKRSDFEMGEGTKTLYQHDARRQPDGTITLFDNGGMFVSEESRVVEILPDTEGMTAALTREYTHPGSPLAVTQGNAQTLPNGNVFVGWGSEPVLSEFSRDGDLLFSARLPAEVESYRAFRLPWTGRPEDDPSLALGSGPDGAFTLHASWNGATEVTAWEVLTGPAPDRLEPAGSVPSNGFETAIALSTGGVYVGVRAVDRSGKTLGESKVMRVRG